MSDGRRNLDFWVRVLNTAEYLDPRAAAPPDDKVSDHLLALEEAFGQSFDPADDFEEYVLVQLCRALRRRLEQ